MTKVCIFFSAGILSDNLALDEPNQIESLTFGFEVVSALWQVGSLSINH